VTAEKEAVTGLPEDLRRLPLVSDLGHPVLLAHDLHHLVGQEPLRL